MKYVTRGSISGIVVIDFGTSSPLLHFSKPQIPFTMDTIRPILEVRWGMLVDTLVGFACLDPEGLAAKLQVSDSFRRFDVDNSGKLDSKEFRYMQLARPGRGCFHSSGCHYSREGPHILDDGRVYFGSFDAFGI